MNNKQSTQKAEISILEAIEKISILNADEKNVSKSLLTFSKIISQINKDKKLKETQDDVERLYEVICDKFNKYLSRTFILLYESTAGLKSDTNKLLRKKMKDTLLEKIQGYICDFNNLNETLNSIRLKRNLDKEIFNLLKQAEEKIERNLNDSSCVNKDKKDLIEEMLISVYLYFLLEFQSDKKIILSLEKCYIENYAGLNESQQNKIIGKSILAILKKPPYSKKLSELGYVYFGISGQIESLSQNNSRLKRSNELVSEKNELLKVKIKELNNEISKLSDGIEEKQEQIEQLTETLEQEKRRLLYEKNKYEKQFITLKKSLSMDLKKSMKLEIEGIETVLQNIPEREKVMVMRRIKNIIAIIDALGG